MPQSLAGQSALVCASTRGLGFAVAKALLAQGAKVFICGRSEQGVAEARRMLLDSHLPDRLKDAHNGSIDSEMVKGMAIDLTDKNTAQRLASQALTDLGSVDILVNNVGGPPPSTALDTSEEQWRDGFERLFLSAASLTQRLIAPMRQRKYGRVITITSLSVMEPIENLVVSTAMRQAVTGFMKTLAMEVAADGVTVNTVLPGVIHTQRIEELRRSRAQRLGTNLEAEMAQTAATIPARRLGRPEELGAVVAFLASPLASYVTGCNIPVDGGLRRGM